MNRLQTAKQRILESNLNLSEKSRLLEKYQKFEEKLGLLLNIEISEVEIVFKPKKKEINKVSLLF